MTADDRRPTLLVLAAMAAFATMPLFTRAAEQAFSHVDLFDTVAPRLLNFPEPSRFKF